MASYYYLIASLPTLKADGELPLHYDEFLEMCRGNVSGEVCEILENLTLSAKEGPLIDEWAPFYGALSNELNYQRSMRLGKSYSSAYDKEPGASNAVTAALNAQNPLEAERVLLEYEFSYLDSLVSLHYFDDYVLIGYAIKLKLLERLNSFDSEKGSAEFQRLFEQVQQRVLSL